MDNPPAEPSGTEAEEKLFQCYECPEGIQIFATEEEFLTHKWDQIRTSKGQSHMKCHVCDREHHTFEGLMRHYQLNHPVKQKLECPGCKMPFIRLAQLMGHLEGDECPYIMGDRVKANRIHKALAANEAADATSLSELGIFTLGDQPMGDYGRYMGIDGHPGVIARLTGHGHSHDAAQDGQNGQDDALAYGWDTGPTGPPVRGAVHGAVPSAPSNAAASSSTPPPRFGGALSRATKDFRRGDSKAPDLLTDDTSPVSRRARGLNVWSSGLAMLEPEQTWTSASPPPMVPPQQGQRGAGSAMIPPPPNAMEGSSLSPAQDLTQNRHQQLDISQFGSESVQNLFNPDHPDHPHFNVFKYKNRITGRFACPNETCRRDGKAFKSPNGLISHLRSNTSHTSLRVQCPSCLSFFKSIHALMQHCESQSTRCHFRHSDEFQPFLDILTGGVADIQGHNIDLTLEYGVKPNAAKALLQEEVYHEEE